MKRNFSKPILILIGIILFFYIFHLLKESDNKKKEDFFIKQCEMAFYNDSEYTGSNEILQNFIEGIDRKILSKKNKLKIEREYSGDYISDIDSDVIHNFCKNFSIIYNERLEEKEYDYNYCEYNKCR